MLFSIFSPKRDCLALKNRWGVLRAELGLLHLVALELHTLLSVRRQIVDLGIKQAVGEDSSLWLVLWVCRFLQALYRSLVDVNVAESE